MLERLIPRSADNRHAGSRAALWVFGLLLLLRAATGANSIFNGRSVAAGADRVPLDAYPAAAAQTVVSLFALMGVTSLVICLLCALVLLRYRALLPLMFALLLLEHLGRRLALLFIPVVREGAAPGLYINLLILALLAGGLALTLRGRGDARTATPR